MEFHEQLYAPEEKSSVSLAVATSQRVAGQGIPLEKVEEN
jgi:hypothetical protein